MNIDAANKRVEIGSTWYRKSVQRSALNTHCKLLLLLFGSVASWVIIFRKKRVLDRAEEEADRFEERFWSGAELSRLYAGATERGRDIGGLEAIFEGGFREFHKVRQRRGGDSRMQLESAQDRKSTRLNSTH